MLMWWNPLICCPPASCSPNDIWDATVTETESSISPALQSNLLWEGNNKSIFEKMSWMSPCLDVGCEPETTAALRITGSPFRFFFRGRHLAVREQLWRKLCSIFLHWQQSFFSFQCTTLKFRIREMSCKLHIRSPCTSFIYFSWGLAPWQAVGAKMHQIWLDSIC